MRKYLLMSLLTLYSFILLAFAENLSANLYSYYGTEYFPEKEKYNYQQKDLFKFGSRFNLPYQNKLSIMLSYSHNYLQEAIRLDSLQLKHDWQNTNVSFQIYNKKIGTSSYLRNLDVTDPLYDKGILENYRFSGVAWCGKLPKLTITAELGGNEFNSVLSTTAISYRNANYLGKLNLLYAGRSNFNNQKSIFIWLENNYSTSILSLYLAAGYEDFMESSHFSHSSRSQLYLETLFPIRSHLQVAASYKNENNNRFAISYKDNYTIAAGWEDDIFKQNLIFSYTKTPLYNQRKLTNISGVAISPNWNLALNLSYYHPSVGNSYYTAGLQTEWSYYAH
ncbi:MAG: hypothetical protein PWQ09_1794 [Candidatus Cloacimonadota bacterium]|nr:hypothetical protein [Candidatus Cloacimonadota bacterium]